MNFWSYSPEDIQVLIGGFYAVEGLADGTFVEVTKDVMPYTTTRSADRMTGRKYTNDSSFSVNISVINASPANDLFTRLWLLDEATQMAKFPLLIKDSLGSGYFYSSTTWFETIPPLSYSTDATTRTWGLRSNEGVIFIGGNDSQTAIENLANLALSGVPLVKQLLDNLGG